MSDKLVEAMGFLGELLRYIWDKPRRILWHSIWEALYEGSLTEMILIALVFIAKTGWWLVRVEGTPNE